MLKNPNSKKTIKKLGIEIKFERFRGKKREKIIDYSDQKLNT